MTLTGARIIAETLHRLEVKVVFGIVGIPVVEVANTLIEKGIRFIGFRNEQSASYAASCYGYLTGKPGVLLVVGGPGLIHALPGVLNSNSNGWPLLVFAGSSSADEVHKGGFQELDQVSYVTPHTKFAARPDNLSQIPWLISKAYRTAFMGRPGSTYIDLPANIIQGETSVSEFDSDFVSSIVPFTSIPKSVAPQSQLSKVSDVIFHSKSPLVIIGKGAAYTNASDHIRSLVETHNFPFLPTPMGKGVLSDTHPLNLNSARSQALKNADVIILIGARLNWILHHGEAPRFKKDVKFIQIDICGEEIGNSNAQLELGLIGDIPLIIEQLNVELSKITYNSSRIEPSLLVKKHENIHKLQHLESISSSPLKYNRVYKIMKDEFTDIQDSITYVSEGANTMDISRVSFDLTHPKTRLDAGTNATMGVGMGYSIAAKINKPDSIVVAIEGDSAFGFSGMEVETMVRYNLPVIIVVMNNSGVYHGAEDGLYTNTESLPSTALGQEVRYDLVAKGLGANGVLVRTEDDLRDGLKFALANNSKGQTTLLNVIIDKGLGTKLSFGWQNKKGKL